MPCLSVLFVYLNDELGNGITVACSSVADPGHFGVDLDPDPCFWLMDPDSDPDIFVTDLQDVNKKLKF